MFVRPQDAEARRTPLEPRRSADPSALDQLRVQIDVDLEEQQEPGKAPPGAHRQLLVVMRHGQRQDEVDPTWSAKAERPFDPPLTPFGEQQAFQVAERLKGLNLKRVYVSPFHRCLQTTMHCMRGLEIPPQRWTVSCAVSEFLNPHIMVKKGGSVPPGDINQWFWLGAGLREHLRATLPKQIADVVGLGRQRFERYPENLYSSRKRYIRAFQTIADEAQGENVLVVTHGDAVNASVSRIWPWAIVHPVHHTGFTVASRQKRPDGNWSKWHMVTSSGESGVWWRMDLVPAYHVFRAGQGMVRVGQHAVGSVLGGLNRMKPF